MVGDGKGLPVKIITDNCVETVAFGNTEISHPHYATAKRGRVTNIYMYDSYSLGPIKGHDLIPTSCCIISTNPQIT